MCLKHCGGYEITETFRIQQPVRAAGSQREGTSGRGLGAGDGRSQDVPQGQGIVLQVGLRKDCGTHF